MEKQSGEPLAKWRSMASFDPRRMRIELDGEEKIQNKEEIYKILEQDPIFKKGSQQGKFEEIRELNYRRWQRVLELGLKFDMAGDLSRSMAILEVLEEFGQGLSARYTLHSSVFCMAIMSTGTERHQEILRKGLNDEIVGCFCLTELSHGSNSQQMQTTATFDRGEFVFDTPNIESTKVWAGNLGMSATHAVVFALLWVSGKCHGLHSFVLQVRDMKTWNPLEGIVIGDMGEKQGQWNAVENGWMQFKQHRAPLTSLLNKGCDVTEDGRYVSAFKNERERKSVSLGALSIGRVGIVGKGALACILAATISIRYSAVRKQFGPPGKEEQSILSYPLQRRRVLPMLSAAICIKIFHRRFSDKFNEYMMRVMSGEKSDELVEMSREVHALSSAAKPRSTWLGIQALAEARAACGGHGMLFCSRLNELRDSFDPSQTFEGENNMIVQQAANYLLAKSEERTSTSPMGTADFLHKSFHKFSGAWSSCIVTDVLNAYGWLLNHLVQDTKVSLQRMKGTTDLFTAKNNAQLLALDSGVMAGMAALAMALQSNTEKTDAGDARMLSYIKTAMNVLGNIHQDLTALRREIVLKAINVDPRRAMPSIKTAPVAEDHMIHGGEVMPRLSGKSLLEEAQKRAGSNEIVESLDKFKASRKKWEKPKPTKKSANCSCENNNICKTIVRTRDSSLQLKAGKIRNHAQ